MKFEAFETEIIDEIIDVIASYSEMGKNERYFINGFIRSLKPSKILELGVGAGGSSAIVLNAIKDFPNSHLVSVDYLEFAYRQPDKSSGFIVYEKFPELMTQWQIYRGGDISNFIEKIGGDIDLLILDTIHVHPGEILDFICVLPFLQDGAWVLLHDISVFYSSKLRNDALACRYLWSSVVSERKICPELTDWTQIFPNLGAFIIGSDTRKYIQNVFESLIIPWKLFPSEHDIANITSLISKYYPEEYSLFFNKILDFQRILKSRPAPENFIWEPLELKFLTQSRY